MAFMGIFKRVGSSIEKLQQGAFSVIVEARYDAPVVAFLS